MEHASILMFERKPKPAKPRSYSVSAERARVADIVLSVGSTWSSYARYLALDTSYSTETAIQMLREARDECMAQIKSEIAAGTFP